MRDTFLVIQHSSPIHFREVANSLLRSSTKGSLPQLVTKLIKIPRFVLVGRGLYALASGAT